MDQHTAIEIAMLRVERKSYGEIAKRIGLSVNTVKSYYFRELSGPINDFSEFYWDKLLDRMILEIDKSLTVILVGGYTYNIKYSKNSLSSNKKSAERTKKSIMNKESSP